MTDIDFFEAFARLLTDPTLRARFVADRARTVVSMCIRPGDDAQILALDPVGLVAQAATLVDKRLHEASELIPVTWANLGVSARPMFLSYAEGEWAPDAARPLADAARFARHLASRGDARVHLPELHRMEFLSRGTRWSVRLVASVLRGRRRRSLDVLVRMPAGAVRGVSLYLGL